LLGGKKEAPAVPLGGVKTIFKRRRTS
jgi:hypothetical protein